MEWRLSFPSMASFSLHSLKNRMIAVLLLSTLIPLMLSGGISYFSITSILENKIQSGVHSNLRQVQISLVNTLSNLNHVSQQLAFNGTVGRDLAKYLETDDILLKDQLGKGVQNNVNLIRFTNPDLGHMFYYFADTQSYVFPEPMLSDKFVPDNNPRLLQQGELTYYGPHRTTLSRFIDRTVLSVTRKVDVPGYDNLYVYIETSFQLTQNVLQADNASMSAAHLLINEQNRIAYSENSERFPVGSLYEPVRNREGGYESQGSLLFEEPHDQGWKLVAVIPKENYNSEKNLWIRQFALFTCFSILIALIFAWTIWRTVRRPLARFNKEIKQVQDSNFHSPLKMTKIIEFDFLLRKFQLMRQQIWGLLQEVKEKEKRKTEMEVEKLLFQINPHFIHNTLDTIRWLARSKGMLEIDNLISALNRVLYYNMGKGGSSTIREEIAALTDYVELQRIRYDFAFTVHIHVNEDVLDLPIPRFILQPLVENCLYHGLKDEGMIEVRIEAAEGRYASIRVQDNGAGMKEEEMKQLLENQSRERRKVGMGIGLYYVNRMIRTQYGEDASFDIRSKPGEGTAMSIRIPLEPKGEGED
ncbi:sensor histidine kinase [Paenibacillus sp. MBLB4367]|uniref:sensor histidine kinase n=1 Tax=Paenibacillus sp. MBLB4367 TaxID=3384767 RepID=UPI0039081595